MLRQNWEHKEGLNICRTRSFPGSRSCGKRPKGRKILARYKKFLRKPTVVQFRIGESNMTHLKGYI